MRFNYIAVMVQALLVVVFVRMYYMAAEMENAPRILWASLSFFMAMITWLILGWGWLGLVVGQVALFIGITGVRLLQDARRHPK